MTPSQIENWISGYQTDMHFSFSEGLRELLFIALSDYSGETYDFQGVVTPALVLSGLKLGKSRPEKDRWLDELYRIVGDKTFNEMGMLFHWGSPPGEEIREVCRNNSPQISHFAADVFRAASQAVPANRNRILPIDLLVGLVELLPNDKDEISSCPMLGGSAKSFRPTLFKWLIELSDRRDFPADLYIRLRRLVSLNPTLLGDTLDSKDKTIPKIPGWIKDIEKFVGGHFKPDLFSAWSIARDEGLSGGPKGVTTPRFVIAAALTGSSIARSPFARRFANAIGPQRILSMRVALNQNLEMYGDGEVNRIKGGTSPEIRSVLLGARNKIGSKLTLEDVLRSILEIRPKDCEVFARERNVVEFWYEFEIWLNGGTTTMSEGGTSVHRPLAQESDREAILEHLESQGFAFSRVASEMLRLAQSEQRAMLPNARVEGIVAASVILAALKLGESEPQKDAFLAEFSRVVGHDSASEMRDLFASGGSSDPETTELEQNPNQKISTMMLRVIRSAANRLADQDKEIRPIDIVFSLAEAFEDDPSWESSSCDRLVERNESFFSMLVDWLHEVAAQLDFPSELKTRLDRLNETEPAEEDDDEVAENTLPRSPFDGTIGKRTYLRREASSSELCLGIVPYSAAISETLRSASEEGDFVFALYGPWGRGKTKLARAVQENLSEHKYLTIFFSAWKFPSRPEVWVHLYQEVSKVAMEGSWFRKAKLSFQVGILRQGWAQILWALGFLMISRIPGLMGPWLANGLGVLSLLSLSIFFWRVFSSGKSILNQYMHLPDHAEKLGLQAVIGADLSNLLKVWVSPPLVKTEPSDPEAFPPGRVNFSGLHSGNICRLIAAAFLLITSCFVIWQIWEASPRRSETFAQVSQALEDRSKDLISAVESLREGIDNGNQMIRDAILDHGSEVRSQSQREGVPKEGPTITPSPSPSIPRLSVEINISGMVADSSAGKTEIRSESDPGASSRITNGQLRWQKVVACVLIGGLGLAALVFLFVITGRITQVHKLLLVVDDLDRCDPDQMLAVVESLRMFLDDPAMSSRMQIMMLLDRTMLELALDKRRRTSRIPADAKARFAREQREKWFVTELELPPLSDKDLNEAVNLIVDREANAANGSDGAGSGKDSVSNISEPVGDGSQSRSDVDEEGLVPIFGHDSGNPSKAPETGPDVKSDLAEVAVTPPKNLQSNDRVEEFGNPTESNEEHSWSDDTTFSVEERALIKDFFLSMQDENLTPRRIRSLTLRYQLARLILRHLGARPKPAEILAFLADPGLAERNDMNLIRRVVRSVS